MLSKWWEKFCAIENQRALILFDFAVEVGKKILPLSLVPYYLPCMNQGCLLAKIHTETRAVRTFNNRPDYRLLDSASGQEVHADMLADLEFAF